mgnify:CR=1 FL=1
MPSLRAGSEVVGTAVVVVVEVVTSVGQKMKYNMSL